MPQTRMVQSKWQRLPGHRNLKGRAGHTATVVGKRIFVLGGRNGNTFFNDIWVFDTETEQWQQLQAHASLSPRAYHTATLVRDCELWVIGGSDKDVMYGDVHMFNTDTLEWASPVARGALAGKVRGTHAAVVHPLQPNAILIYGGYGSVESQWLNELAILHTDTLQWDLLSPKGLAPSARGYHTLTSVGTFVALYGGKGELGIAPSGNNLSIYDAAANTWSVVQALGTSPLPRSNHAAALLGENLVIIHGGRNGTERLSDICALRISPGQPPGNGHIQVSWHHVPQEPIPKPRGRKRGEHLGATTLSDSPGGRAAHSLISQEYALYLFGGYGGQGVTFDDIYIMRKFPELSMLNRIEEPISRGLPRRGGVAAGARRFSFPVDNEGEKEPKEGWRSTKRPRRPPAGMVDYSTCTDGIKSPKFIDPGIPRTSGGQQLAGTGFLETPESSGVKKSLPFEKEFMKEVNELLTKARSNGEVRDKDLTARELEVHKREVASLQQTVIALKSEVRVKSLGEVDLRERNAKLEHDLETCRRQVLVGNQKIENLTIEVSSLKSSARALETEKAEEKHEMASKIRSLEERLAERDRENSKGVQSLKTAESRVKEIARSLEEAKKGQSNAAQERDDLKRSMWKLELEVQKRDQLKEVHEREKASLLKEIADLKSSEERLLGEVTATKESTRALQETVERLAKQLERENSKLDALESDRDELRHANAALTAECAQEHLGIRQITVALENAEANAELLRSELRTARVSIERSEGEVARLKDSAEQSREHIATLHVSLTKNEEDLKSLREDNERWRTQMREIEEFEQLQARAIQAIKSDRSLLKSEGLKPRGVPKNAEWSIGRHDANSPLVIITGTSTLNESKSDQADPMDAWELHIEMELIGAMEQRIEV